MSNKERVLVMNGSRLLEQEVGGKWAVKDVKPAGSLKPGIYNIHTATKAETTKEHTGIIIHADAANVVQVVGKDKFVKHDTTAFSAAPSIGVNVTISYDGQNAKTTIATTQSQGRGR